MASENERTEPCACDETYCFFDLANNSYAQCRKCGAYWRLELNQLPLKPNTGAHAEHPPVDGGYRGADHSQCPIPPLCKSYRSEECAAAQASRSSVIAEAMLRDAVRTDAPCVRTRSKVSVPPLEFLFAEWQRRSGNTLPLDSTERKAVPVQGGCYAYFPAALAAIAAWSYFNNQKHNPGQPLHWSQSKSSDHPECLARHGIDIGDARVAGDEFAEFVEAVARAWRALGDLQMMAQRLGAPLAPGAVAP